MSDPAALFGADATRWVPTELARGPWDPGSLHGGPVAALVARAAEGALPADTSLRPARLTVELLRPVRLEPLEVTAELVRPGRKVSLVQVSVAAAGTTVARALALFIRRATVPVPEGLPVEVPPSPDHGRASPPWAPDEPVAFHNSGVEHAFVRGSFVDPGPATDWIRLRVPVVPDEEPTPFQRAVAAADFGNGISGMLEHGRYVFINPDLTVHLHRLPEGEWVCLESTTHLGADGVGLAESALYDERGRVGRSVQSLLIDTLD